MTTYLLRNTMLELLLRIDEDSGYSHLLINHEINQRNIDAKDVGLLTEVVYGTMERKLTIDYFLDPFIASQGELDSWVKMVLRMSVYQMVYLDKVPAHAIINEAVGISKERGHQGIASFVNGVLRNVQRKGLRKTTDIKDKVERLSIETSHPKWLVDRWISHYGFDVTKEMCEANLSRKEVAVRVQPLRISRDVAMERLNEQGLQTKPSAFSSQGIIIEEGNVLHTDLFLDGYLTVQDQSSMLATEMLDVASGMHVLDACSAPGGKVTHIAEKMADEGKVNAYDLHKKKINLVKEKASTLNLSIIDAQFGDARKLQEFHEDETFDRILIDAPCSGLGVIRNKPDVKYNKNIRDIERLATIQLDIITKVAPLLKKDGLLVYSTCTVDVEENEAVVKAFLEANENFRVDDNFSETLPPIIKQEGNINEYGLQIFPQTYGTDGFFMTRLIKQA